MLLILLLAQVTQSNDLSRLGNPLRQILPPGFVEIPRPGMGREAIPEIRSRCGQVVIPPIKIVLEQNRLTGDSVMWNEGGAQTRARLACIRAVLSTTNAPEREGFDMPLATPWSLGAIKSLLYALKGDPAEEQAADVLALVALRARRPASIRRIGTALSIAVDRGVRGSPTLRGCAELSYRIGDTLQLRKCADIALAIGVDSTWHQILLARLHYDRGDTLNGESHFFAAVEAAHDSISRAIVDWHFQWFLSPREMPLWRSTLPTSAAARVRALLAIRDVRDGQRPGARLAEHFKRLAHSEKDFWLTSSRLMEPQSMGYSRFDTTVRLRYGYNRWQLEFDDRGVVWMRFGEPTRISGTASAEWYVYAENGLRDSVMFVDGADPGVSFTRLVGGNIRLFTQTDDNGLRGDRTISVAAQFNRIWDPVTGGLTGLVGYSLDLRKMVRTDSTPARIAVDLNLQQWDPLNEVQQDTLVHRELLLPKDIGNKMMTGYVHVPTTPGATVWSLAARQGNQAAGVDRADYATASGVDGLLMSDIVLGASSQRTAWQRANETITLAPLGSFDRREEVKVFFQTRSLQPMKDVAVAFEIYQFDKGARLPRPVLSVGLHEDLPGGLGNFNRGMNVSRLAPGLYSFEVVLTSQEGKVLVRQVARMILR